MRKLASLSRKPLTLKPLNGQFRMASTISQDSSQAGIDGKGSSVLGAFKLWETVDKTSLSFTLTESHGVLNKALNILTSNQINLTRISSKPSKFVLNNWRKTNFYIDIDGTLNESNVQKAIRELKLIADDVTEVGSVEVPWFPTQIEDFDNLGKNVLAAGDGI